MLTAILDADLASITIGEGFGSYVFATGEGFFQPHENKELAGRLSWAIWDANHGYCAIEVQEACVEIHPQHTYQQNRSDYDRLWADRFPTKGQLHKIFEPLRFLGASPRGL